MTIETVNSEAFLTTGYERNHFSQAVKSSGLMFCSGVIGTGADGRVPEDMTEEFRAAFQGVVDVLALEGLDLSDVVEATTYHVDMPNTLGAFFAVRDEFLTPPWSAWTAIGTTALAIPGARVEIRVTAQLKSQLKS
ncbi:MAG: RidA family protein [Pseudomonadota bacterium]